MDSNDSQTTAPFAFLGRVHHRTEHGDDWVIEHWRHEDEDFFTARIEGVYLTDEGTTDPWKAADAARYGSAESAACAADVRSNRNRLTVDAALFQSQVVAAAEPAAVRQIDCTEPLHDPNDWDRAPQPTPLAEFPPKLPASMTTGLVRGLTFEPVFSRPGADVLGERSWRRVDVSIKDTQGNEVWGQKGVEVPEGWSDQAAQIVASKYFYGDPAKGDNPGQGGREHSVRQLVTRVCATIADWGLRDGYFATPGDAACFYAELVELCLGQYAAFNSPVWFNVGLGACYGIEGPPNGWVWDGEKAVPCRDAYHHPQASACFIQSVKDDMQSICELATSEMLLFKYGSGTGTDLSTLRSSREKLSGGGKPSGPVSFMRVFDAGAGIVKSGGKTRRAAKMQTLKCWHPDVLEFVRCKAKEEKKAKALLAAGYSGGMTGSPDEAYSSVFYQNANLSVRVTDEFMGKAVGGDVCRGNGDGSQCWYPLRAVTTGDVVEDIRACDLLDEIAEATHACGDPGLQYEDTIQRWHTCPNTAPINSSNPCSEYMFIDDSACNLASINLMKFRRDDGTFDHVGFRAAVRTMIVAQEILVDRASYPTNAIAENSHRFRPLGLGYANLGSLIMANGLAYDSDEARSLAGAVTSIMGATAYLTSSDVARVKGPFAGFEPNREPMLEVMGQHEEAAGEVYAYARVGSDAERLAEIGQELWNVVIMQGDVHGFRNSQVTVLAPTGTIAFMMDCDTTGVEPETALVKYKTLAGGGGMTIVNRTVPLALETLGYPRKEDVHGGQWSIDDVLDYVEDHGTVEGCVYVKTSDLPVFDCAFPSRPGGRTIHHVGHLKMMAAVQPFLSGAISKTVNMPETATVQEIRDAYVEGWRLGLKAVAIYRDGSKGQQPLSTRRDDSAAEPEAPSEEAIGITAASAGEQMTDDWAWRVGDWHLPGSSLVYRPGSDRTIGTLEELAKLANLAGQPAEARRERLPDTRRSVTHKFSVGGHEGYATVGFFPDGRPGELFVTMSKEGSTIGGLMDQLATAISIGLQHGVPLGVFVNKLMYTSFEPSGPTKNPDVRFAKSLCDYLGRWLGCEFVAGFHAEHSPRAKDGETKPKKLLITLSYDQKAKAEALNRVVSQVKQLHESAEAAVVTVNEAEFLRPEKGVVREFPPPAAGDPPLEPDESPTVPSATVRQERVFVREELIQVLSGPPCDVCGNIMTRTGSCYSCRNCGAHGGCG